MDQAGQSLDAAKIAAVACAECTKTVEPFQIPLAKGRTQVVFGAGHPHADLMLIGEAPGKDEDEAGRPFIGHRPGQAGRILDDRLEEIGVPRNDVFITNVVMCRPTESNGGPPANRKPTSIEVDECARWLDQQVTLVRPRLVVPLGVTATCRTRH